MGDSHTGWNTRFSPSETVIDLDATVYRLSAIKKAAYKFGDKCHVRVSTAESSHIRVELKAKNTNEDMVRLSGDFCNEVLDQELREVVAEETATMRNLLLAQAFSATSLIDALGDEGSFRTDPLGIRGKPIS
jgi:His-Xaa-Ser system protein HxsD